MISATAASAIGAMTLLWFTPAQPASIPPFGLDVAGR